SGGSNVRGVPAGRKLLPPSIEYAAAMVLPRRVRRIRIGSFVSRSESTACTSVGSPAAERHLKSSIPEAMRCRKAWRALTSRDSRTINPACANGLGGRRAHLFFHHCLEVTRHAPAESVELVRCTPDVLTGTTQRDEPGSRIEL